MQNWGKTKVQCLVRNTHSGIYYARARVNGKLLWKTLETDSLTVAKARLPKVLAELGRGSAKSVAMRSAGHPILSFGDAATLHLANIQARVDLKPATKHYWNQVVAALLASWPDLAARKLTKVTEIDTRDWAAAYQAQVSATRFNNTVDCLRAIFALGIKEGVIFNNPAAELGKVKVRAKQFKLPSREEFTALVSAVRSAGAWCSQQCGDLIEFLAFSGCRLGEAGYVRWTDVDLEGGMMWVNGDPLTGTKNWERRQVPIIPAMQRLLEDLRSNPRAVRDLKRLNANFVLAVTECQKAIDAACAKLGIKRVVHHDLRHLFATACIESGIDIPTVAKWLGHKDGGALAMKTYGHLRTEHALQMAKKVSF
jgi:integrase